jgi:NAD(P)H-dependent FMN reductase/ketosteroid isomerase-like protein
MSTKQRVAVLVGSLRADSFSRKIARTLIDRAPSNLECRIVEIGDLPLYNEDLEQNTPAAWQEFRTELRRSDAVLFVTPEYNRSIPGCLKNALDVGSRPPKQNVFDGVPAAVVSVTPYKLGAFGANHALRQTFVFLNMPVLQQPEAYVGKAGELLDQAGQVKDADTDQLFKKFMQAFAQWIATVRAGAGGDFDALLRERSDVAAAYVQGDAEPLAKIATEHEPASFFSPKGDALQGAAAVLERFRSDAKAFHGGSTRVELVQSGAGGALGFWCGLQHAEVRRGGEVVTMTLRVTEIFRFEAGAWRLVHRHADPAK